MRAFILQLTTCTLILSLLAGCNDSSGRDGQFATGPGLSGIAEDLWGGRIDLDGLGSGLVLVQPFSPANCGYCLFDGVFVEANYFSANTASGGTNLYQCLFNPQRDIYTYTKHYRDDATAVLTFPPQLHRNHRNGFPFLMAFRNGELLHHGGLHPYEETYAELAERFWPERDALVTLTSPIHMANRFIHENDHDLTVFIMPDGDEDRMAAMWESISQWSSSPGTVKYEGELTLEDLRRNLHFEGKLEDFRFTALAGGSCEADEPIESGTPNERGKQIPIGLDGPEIRLGEYRFSKAEVCLKACFPNPYNRGRYVCLNLSGQDGTAAPPSNGVDYAIYPTFAAQSGGARAGIDPQSISTSATQSNPLSTSASPPPSTPPSVPRSAVLLQGFCAKAPGNYWKFADSLAFGPALKGICSAGSCHAPVREDGQFPKQAPKIHVSNGYAVADGTLYTLGSANCRFPAIALDCEGLCWVAWEEGGDILLASIGNRRAGFAITERGAPPVTDWSTSLAIEWDASDSFSPALAWDGSRLWVLYLNNRDGFYRLYARHYRNQRLSPEILVSEIGPYDAITPAVATDGAGKLVVAWSEWQANFRILKHRTIDQRSLGEVADTAVKDSGINYINAWYPSLAFDAQGQPWGAWNQHYPAILGVCAGNLTDEAASVTRLSENPNEAENGGYPSIVIDAASCKSVFWESFGWDVLRGEAQAILTSSLDESSGQWTLPIPLSRANQTFFNQTPRAVADSSGVIWVTWSGRDRAGQQPWGVYLSRQEGGDWTTPRRLSPEGENARAPEIAAGPDGEIWVSWHAGVGCGMRVKVIQLRLGAAGV